MVVRHNFPTAVLWRDPALLFLLLLHLASFMSLSDYQVKPSLTQLPQKDGEVVEIGSGDIMSGVFSWESVGFCQPAAEGSWFPQRRRSSGKLREASWRPAEEASRFHRHYSPMSILNNIMSTWKTVWVLHSPQLHCEQLSIIISWSLVRVYGNQKIERHCWKKSLMKSIEAADLLSWRDQPLHTCMLHGCHHYPSHHHDSYKFLKALWSNHNYIDDIMLWLWILWRWSWKLITVLMRSMSAPSLPRSTGDISGLSLVMIQGCRGWWYDDEFEKQRMVRMRMIATLVGSMRTESQP